MDLEWAFWHSTIVKCPKPDAADTRFTPFAHHHKDL